MPGLAISLHLTVYHLSFDISYAKVIQIGVSTSLELQILPSN